MISAVGVIIDGRNVLQNIQFYGYFLLSLFYMFSIM
jgi:hypothetical protein